MNEKLFATETNQIIESLKQKIREKHEKNGGTTVIGPFDSSLTAEQKALWHAHLLFHAYNGGHPASKRPFEAFVKEQQEGRMLTWFLISPDGQPVGMANIEILPSGIAEMCRTCKLKSGEPLIDGRILDKEYNNTVVMYQRLVDFLTNEKLKNSVWCLQADLRLVDTINLPNGDYISAGVYTQHINLSAGLRPFLICVPRYQVAPENYPPYQEVFLESRLYTQPSGVDLTPIYTPPIEEDVGIPNIVKALYNFAFGGEPEIIFHSKESNPAKLELEQTAGIHFSTIYAEGDISRKQLDNITTQALSQSRFVELIIPNHPGNIITQVAAYDLGFIPLGVMPGGNFLIKDKPITIPTTIHFGKLREDLKETISPIRLANDLTHTIFPEIISKLWKKWKYSSFTL